MSSWINVIFGLMSVFNLIMVIWTNVTFGLKSYLVKCQQFPLKLVFWANVIFGLMSVIQTNVSHSD